MGETLETMNRLEDALLALGYAGQFELSGRWATLRGERCVVFVVEAPNAEGYYTWCGDPAARSVEFYPEPDQAIVAGMRRANGDPSGTRSTRDHA